MKKELSKWILLLEVVSIVALHAYKHKSDKALVSSKQATIQRESGSTSRSVFAVASMNP